MKENEYKLVDEYYLKYKADKLGYKIIEEVEEIKRRCNLSNYYYAIDYYSGIYGIDFGVNQVELTSKGKVTIKYWGFLEYNGNCILKERIGMKYEDQPYDYCDRETCYARIAIRVLSELKTPVQYKGENDKYYNWQYNKNK
ncbi:MAG: hypothetical protein WC135_06810 [Bacteroidales bacterium]